eukprot:561175-Ditylum_brightwellii.AAC.1
MSIVQLPSEEDYWKEDYSISTAEKSADKCGKYRIQLLQQRQQELKHPGVASAEPYHNVMWTMVNWSTSKLLFEKMVDMKQYPFGIMKKEQHVPPYLLHGKTKKPTKN